MADSAPPAEIAQLPPFKVEGGLWFSVNDTLRMHDRRIDLLEQIGASGSITQAARNVGLSYKGACDNLEAMRNALGVPLLHSERGGKGGGGSRLTPEAMRIVQLYRSMQHEHQRFLRNLDGDGMDFEAGLQLLRRLTMKTSSRNQFYGKVVGIQLGPVNVEVQIALEGRDRLVAVITHQSFLDLGLAPGGEVWALVKANSVLLASEDVAHGLSARNRLSGTVARITHGVVNADVVLNLDGGATIGAVLTTDSLKELGLREGDRACAVFKASSIILGAPA